MTRTALFIRTAAAVVLSCATIAQHPVDAQELKLMDLKDVDPAMLKDIYDAWEVRDAGGKKRCRVVLKSESTIGGSQIDVGKDCAKTFPIMGDISAWRLYENWTIGFADPLRKLRIRFHTPDNHYVAEPETDGIASIVKK